MADVLLNGGNMRVLRQDGKVTRAAENFEDIAWYSPTRRME